MHLHRVTAHPGGTTERGVTWKPQEMSVKEAPRRKGAEDATEAGLGTAPQVRGATGQAPCPVQQGLGDVGARWAAKLWCTLYAEVRSLNLV